MSLGNRFFPRDFVLVGICTLVADAVVLAEVPLLRLLFGALLVLVLPGYALVSTVSSLDRLERALFSVGSSVVLVSLSGLVIHFTPFAITNVTILVALNAVIFVSLFLGASRRDRKNEAPQSLSVDWPDLLRLETRTDVLLSVVLVGSLLLATGSVAYAVAGPNDGESYTEFYLLAENENDELVADGYPTEFVRGDAQSLHFGIDNREGGATNYAVVVELQRVRTTNGSVTVLEERRLDETQVRVGGGASKTVEHQVTPSMTGEDLRLTYLLYVGTPPEDPTVENAYRSLHLRVDVSEANASS